METTIAKQAELLSGVRTLGLYTSSSDYFEDFAEKNSEALLLADAVVHEGAKLSANEQEMLSVLWDSLLDHLELSDEAFVDMNHLVLATFQRGCRRGAESF